MDNVTVNVAHGMYYTVYITIVINRHHNNNALYNYLLIL
jgi:hypothetical protein